MRGELFACMWTHKDMGLVMTIARARHWLDLAHRTNKQHENCEQLALF